MRLLTYILSSTCSKLTYYTFDNQSCFQTYKMTQSSLVRPLRQITLAQDVDDFESSEQFRLLPLKIRQFFQRLQLIIKNSDQNGYKQDQNNEQAKENFDQSVHSEFCNVFKRLSQTEQIAFMQQLISQIKTKADKKPSQIGYDKSIRQFSCNIRIVSYCVSHWSSILLKLDKDRKTLTLFLQNRVICVFLREYLLRKSKVHSNCFVLQNVGLAAKNNQYTYHIKFGENECENYAELEQLIKRIIVECQAQALIIQIKEESNMKLALSKCRGHINLFLTNKNINKFRSIKNFYQIDKSPSVGTQSSDQSSLKAFADDNSYLEVTSSEKCRIQVSKDDESLYRARFIINDSSTSFTRSFIDSYKKGHNMVFRLKVLQSKQESIQQVLINYTAFYQKIVWKEKIFGQLFIVKQQNTENQISGKNNIESFKCSFINVDHEDNRNFLEFLKITIKVVQNSDGDLQVMLTSKFIPNFDRQAIESYLLKFQDIFLNKRNMCSSVCGANIKPEIMEKLFPEAMQYLEANQFQVEIKAHQTQYKQIQVSRQPIRKQLNNNNIQLLFADNFNDKHRTQQKHAIISKSFLKYHYPLGVVNKKGKIMKEHFLWNNWKRAEKGGLVCKNQELVDRQKKMFKLIIKKFGETLLMGKNIINFSLPVIVFKKESHLQSLAKSYLYSPIFTQKAASISDPLERMKFSVILMITENALSIHMQKPFNPILGETFQGWINGCPIYLQQISHHPPISAYYFLGRGYKKYGCIEPKISVGLNTGSGYSIFPHFVQFDDGTKIQYICAKIVIGGLLIGERTFNFEDKIYAYDRKNRYFASVKFGPIKKGFFSSSNQPEDYFFGQIYQVTPEFEKYFDQETGIKPHPEEKHIVKKLSYFDGIWNSFININGEEVLNFKTDLPYEFEDQAMPLPSDSKYREDLSNLLAGDLQAAQMAKEEMEEVQRHDRKLREQNNK